MKSRCALVMLMALCTMAFAVGPANIDTQKSTLTIRVFKTGFFSVFAHDHQISAPIERGTFSEEQPAVELAIDARKLKVMDKESASELEKIQKTMLGPEVLDSEKYPEIRFHSTAVEHTGNGEWLVRGELALHGQTQPVAMKVKKVNGHFQGTTEIKQKDFGITPVSIAGGSVKVKNEVRIEFDVAGQ